MADLHECRIDRLHPTQITVGMIEVHDKREHLRGMHHDARRDYLREHAIPAVVGPEDKLYLIDHHHLGRALHDEDIEHGFFLIEADLSLLAEQKFWDEMAQRHWAHPVDERGERRDPKAIPKHLAKLIDDPYRSLAGYVRNRSGYEKTHTPFAEFLWADFFRARLRIAEGRDAFLAAVEHALRLARSPEAKALPGWLGGGSP